jgi:hypothetical protein
VTLRYALVDGPAVEERYALDPTGVAGESSVSGASEAVLTWPFLRSDGRDSGEGRAGGDVVDWSLGGSRQRLCATGVALGEHVVPARNGEYVIAEAPAADRRIVWKLE